MNDKLSNCPPADVRLLRQDSCYEVRLHNLFSMSPGPPTGYRVGSPGSPPLSWGYSSASVAGSRGDSPLAIFLDSVLSGSEVDTEEAIPGSVLIADKPVACEVSVGMVTGEWSVSAMDLPIVKVATEYFSEHAGFVIPDRNLVPLKSEVASELSQFLLGPGDTLGISSGSAFGALTVIESSATAFSAAIVLCGVSKKNLLGDVLYTVAYDRNRDLLSAPCRINNQRWVQRPSLSS